MANGSRFGEQLALFDLAPRDRGHDPVSWADAGLQRLNVERFKAFAEFSLDLGRITLLVGANSSGKTSLLQAIRLFFWCVQVCGRHGKDGITFKKAVMPFSEFTLIPAHELRELVHRGVTPNKKEMGVVLRGRLANGLELAFRIYSAYSILLSVEPIKPTPLRMDADEFSHVARRPLYIPGFFGVVTRELVAGDARLEELLNSGHHNEVLRNMVLRLHGDMARLEQLREIMTREFNIGALEIPFSPRTTEFLRAAYKDPANRIPLDFVSAGSGFLQVLQILAHSLQNPSPLLLLDEPDAHMHSALQRSFLTLLRNFAEQENIQVVMASHSETFLREMELSEIRVIDSRRSHAASFPNAAVLQEQLSEAGIWPDHLELAEILRTRRVLLMEGREDEASLDHLGRQLDELWDARRKLLQVVHTSGSSDTTVSRLEFVNSVLEDILPDGIEVVHVRDRDLLSDEGVTQLVTGAQSRGLHLFVAERRNREAYLVEPEVVERAVHRLHGNRVPQEIRSPGAIAALASEEIMVWCQEEIDSLPGAVAEYNRTWMRRCYEGDELRAAEIRQNGFLRTEWFEPIAAGQMPWKLVDGKASLSRIRRRLHQFNLPMPESAIHEAMEPGDYGVMLNEVVGTVQQWTAQASTGA